MKLFNIVLVKSGVPSWIGFVAAQDTTVSGVTTPAAVNAQNFALTQAGEGFALQSCVLQTPFYTA